MYLRRLEVHGFKAFAERQRFEFGPGMTVVVGPNGSGKSNVADAIRWALGEQSARQIRARKTEDVIFSGSDKRRPMGMAEVTLVLDNTEGWMPIEFSEVSVTRRAHRSGENEYLINGQNVRLADVLDLFRRAQVGQNSYAHMSQGLVDEVLALRPSERRELIEEAADVRRHRHQLTLSERRLVETRDNLGHVRMLIREVEPRLRQLARQSRKAAEYQRLSAELSEALQVYLEAELRTAREAHTAAQSGHDQRTERFGEAQREMQRLEARLRDLEAAIQHRRAELERLQARERELAEETLRLEQSVALAQQRTELLGVRRLELDHAIANADVGDAADDAPVDARLAELEAQVAAAQTTLAREREALTSADEATRTVLRQLSELEARRARLEADRDDITRRIAEHQERLARQGRARAEAAARREALLDDLRALGGDALAQRRVAVSLAEAAGQARRRRESVERRLEEEQRAEHEAQEAVRAAEAVVAQLEERRRLLETLAEHVPSVHAGARALLEAARDAGSGLDDAETEPREGGEPLEGIVDAVSRLIRVPAGLETAIEAALAEHLSAVAVDSQEAAYAAVDWLREQRAGTVTLYPLDAIEHVYPLNLFNERGVVGIAAKLVRTEQRYRPLVDTLLGRVIVVEDLRTAQQMVKRGLGSVVTKDGVLLRPGGSLFGGRTGAAAEQFSMQRELDELPEQVDHARAQLGPARQRLERHRASVADAREVVANAREGVDAAEERRRAHEQELAGLRRRQAELRSAMRAVRDVLDAGGEAADAGTELRERRDAAQQGLVAAIAEIATLRDRSEAVGQERDAVAERLTAATRALAEVEAEQRSLRAQRAEREEARRQARQQLAEQRAQFERLVQEQEDLELSLRERREALANVRTARTDAQAAVGPAHAALAELLTEERELNTTRHDTQQTLLTAERALLEGENALRQHASRVQQLLEQVADEGMVVLDDGTVRPAEPVAPAEDEASRDQREAAVEDLAGHGVADSGPEAELAATFPRAIRGGTEVDAEALRQRISELRQDIRALGPVNVEAIEDLGEEQERHEFLTQQVGDLEAAEEELRLAIRELRQLIRTRFVETFHVVNERFGEFFTHFFGGGQAELRLIEEEGEDTEPGVDIFAQPPGKRIANLSVLSGGERSMTSVALLFSLLSVNPAPMVVLDEVDAALDEANVGRFVDTLKDLRDRSQFIVISHNRRTIEAGDALYGVSMGDDSTSQVLSLRLGDLAAAS